MGSLERSDLADDPIAQFERWRSLAAGSGIREPDAMTLATADAEGVPSARMVLLRGADERGFAWHTNRSSLKGRDLAANPQGAIVFHWETLERQVRAAGPVSQLSDEESASYFDGRSRASRIGAWASEQGAVLRDRAALERSMERISERYPDAIPLPPFWGGYRLRPDWIEFWQGRRDRLHDRFVYLRDGDGWTIERLAP